MARLVSTMGRRYIAGAIRETAGRASVCPSVRPTVSMMCRSVAGDGDGGGGGSERRGMEMMSDSQVYVLDAGESVVLECYFTAAKYNMFDYPLLWKKVRQLSAARLPRVSKMANGRRHSYNLKKNEKSPYLGNRLTDFDEIWHDD